MIATNISATKELIEDKKNGFLVRPNNYVEVANIISDFGGNQTLYSLISEKAYFNVFNNFSAATHARKMEEVYMSEV